MLKRTISYLLSSLILIQSIIAQSSSESPYSDQAYDPVQNPAWYETPFLWIGLVMILLLTFLWLRKRAKKA